MDGEDLDSVVGVHVRDRLQDDVRQTRRPDVFLVDLFKDPTEVEVAGGHVERRTIVKAAGTVVAEFDAGDVETHRGAGGRAAASHVQLQQRSRAPTEGCAPAAGREFGALDGIGREDREAATAANVFLFAQ